MSNLLTLKKGLRRKTIIRIMKIELNEARFNNDAEYVCACVCVCV